MADSFKKIYKNIVNYIPSKLLVVFNAMFIVPLLSYLYSEREMSYFFIGIYILNILCTCSSDWITKSIIRFHEKYNIKNTLEDFYSTILFLLIIFIVLIIAIFALCYNFAGNILGIDLYLFFQIVFILLPCGIRQFLFQILRVHNNSFLYTSSIFLYQLFFIVLVILFSNYSAGASLIILAMNLSMLLIDIYIIKKINLSYVVKFKFNTSIMSEVCKYGIPLIATNVCYWIALHFSKLYFQEQALFLYTAVLGSCMLLVNNVIQSVGSSFIFASYPVIVEKYEQNKGIKHYWLKTVQLYFLYIIPIVMTFCLFSNEITQLFFTEKYYQCALILPFFATGTFLHELLKLITMKYHIKNETQKEALIAVFIAIFAIALNITLIRLVGLLGAGLAVLFTEILLLIINSIIKINKEDFFTFAKVAKTFLIMLLTGILIFISLKFISGFLYAICQTPKLIYIIMIVLYLSVYYAICNLLKSKILLPDVKS